MYKFASIIDTLRNELDEYRFIHTLGVAYTAAAIAMSQHIDTDKAMLAGLLHDCAKGINSSEYVFLANRFGIEIRPVEYKHPGLLHAKLGAYYAKEKYLISDEEILSSIRCHTTGKPDMSMLDKILFIADYIEPSRNKQPRLDVLREYAFKDIDKTVLMIMEDTLAYLKKYDPECIDSLSEEAYMFLKNESGERNGN